MKKADDCKAGAAECKPECVHLKAKCARDARDAANWRALMDLCGHWQDGSQTLVKLSQDDATRTCWLQVGGFKYYASSFAGAIAAALERDDADLLS